MGPCTNMRKGKKEKRTHNDNTKIVIKSESFKANYDNSFLLPIGDAVRVILFRNNHAIVMSIFFASEFVSGCVFFLFFFWLSKSPIHQLCLLFHADCFSGSVFLSPCFVVSMRLKYKHVPYTRFTHKNEHIHLHTEMWRTEPWNTPIPNTMGFLPCFCIFLSH